RLPEGEVVRIVAAGVEKFQAQRSNFDRLVELVAARMCKRAGPEKLDHAPTPGAPAGPLLQNVRAKRLRKGLFYPGRPVVDSILVVVPLRQLGLDPGPDHMRRVTALLQQDRSPHMVDVAVGVEPVRDLRDAAKAQIVEG